MRIITTVEEMHAFSSEKRREGKKIGLVPTMGFLHEGHLSLVDKAKEFSDVVVVSIFVNPTQFAPNEDFSQYPRDEERDKKLLSEKGVDAIFFPQADEIYGPGYQTYVDVTEITKKQEGEFRPTHFKGVTTIVSILFNCVMPDFAVFGQKDAQQASVIKRMVKDLKFNINVIIAPIVREADGLAKSSRNIYLSEKKRKDALILSSSLRYAEQMILAGERNVNAIIMEMTKQIAKVDTAHIDYVRIVEADSFIETDKLQPGNKYYFLIACRIGKIRLIDNSLISIPAQVAMTV
ncbi:MAG: pantoate--beta-alanine ligase [Bacteroidota bacterium]|nr:pantoate--beta-alanine ligase [Bacteroidota bacterium]